MRPHVVAWLERALSPTAAQLLAPTWFTMVGLAGLLTLWRLLRHAERDGVDGGAVATTVLAGYVAAVVAGVTMPAIITVVETYVRDGRLALHPAGMTSFWGYLGGAIAVWLTARRTGLRPAWLADRATPMLGVSLALIRVGCFLAGCDHGQLSAVPWAMRFPRGSPAWRDHVAHGLVPASRDASLPVHPTQLYEAALGLAIALAAWAYSRGGHRVGSGRVFVAAAATYAAVRLGIENLRGDETRGLVAGMSSGQVFALALLLGIGGAVARHARRAARPAAD